MKLPPVPPQLLQVTAKEIADIRQKYPQLTNATEDQVRRVIITSKHTAYTKRMAQQYSIAGQIAGPHRCYRSRCSNNI